MGSSNRTRSAIYDAFSRLIRREDFDKITVAEICREADVGKATFYRYFKDKYDVMNENYRRVLFSCAMNPNVKNYRDLYCELYRTATTDVWVSMRRSFQSVGYNSFRNFIATYSYAFAEEITKQNRGGKGYTEAEKLQCQVFTFGIGEMYENWTFGKYNLTVDEAGDALFDIMPKTLKYYWMLRPIRPEDIQV